MLPTFMEPLQVDGAVLLERIAHTCPVARSLHPDVLQETAFTYA